jgi:hypothetical protein
MPITIMPGEVTPTLFVGLGGSGGKAIGRIAKRLRAEDDFELRYRSLVRFVAIDTNDADLAQLRRGTRDLGRVDETVLISDFDKAAYAQLRRGESFEEADPFFTQWVHPDYHFREESGAGAGQIRIESRLSLFRALEASDLAVRLQNLVSDLKSHAHGMRHTSAPIQVFVYFSVAGGTGSGGFLPFAYLMRDLVGDRSAQIIGFAILPEAFEQVIGRNRDGVYANGYAALKELEYLMRLDTQAEPEETTVHYDPRNKHNTTVRRRPYDLMYLVDRPGNFSLDDVGEALADATYVQIFSPILGEQKADYDNYTKENRRLFPDSLWQQGDGYTAFYGSLGASVLILPRRDILEYCARRHAATAVRRYVLLDDDALVSERQREAFRRFAIDPAELAQLSEDARARRIDETFMAKIRLLSTQEGIEGGLWQRIVSLPQVAGGRLADEIGKVEQSFRDITSAVREISADRILDGKWTPAASLNTLGRQVAEAKAAIDAQLATLLDHVATGDWWAEFLSKAGPDGAPELNLYEQRYVLIDFRERAGGPLSSTTLDELRGQVQRLATESDLGSEGRFRSEMNAQAAEIKRTHGGWDKLLTRRDRDFEAARDRAVAVFNEYVDKIRAHLVRAAMFELLSALGRGAEHLRRTFRDIEGSASRIAHDLTERARRYEVDGGIEGLRSEANEFALDVELFQHPSGRERFWSFYYVDQIEGRPELTDQNSVLHAVREAIRPRFDERGRTVRPDARQIVNQIVEELVTVAKRTLEPEVVGNASRSGLRMDDALALEAAYYARRTTNPSARAEDLFADRPLRPSELWSQESVRVYGRRKVETTIAKAQPLSRYDAEARGSIKHPDMLLIGMHASLREGLFEELLEQATSGNAQELHWDDSHRVVFYRSILGVPIYCFPHVNEDMKAAYRRFQAQAHRAWPLHVDKNWETLPDLDPEDRRRELAQAAQRRRGAVLAVALGLARGIIERESNALQLRIREDRALPLGEGMLAAADRMAELQDEMAAIYDSFVAPLKADALRAGDDAEVDTALRKALTEWQTRAQDLELDGKTSSPEYGELREATSLLTSVLG